MKRLVLIAAILMLTVAGPVMAQGQQPPPATAGLGDFVPVTSLPASDQLPAAPMVIGAYAFIWVVLLVYVWTIWRRMKHIETEIADLQRRIQSK